MLAAVCAVVYMIVVGNSLLGGLANETSEVKGEERCQVRMVP